MRSSSRLLFLCLAGGLLLESQAHPLADDGDATRNVASDGNSVELSEILERGQDSLAEKGQEKASANGRHIVYVFATPDYDAPLPH
nr:TPA_inf: conotoxin precursor H [Conus judaeus]